MSGHRSGSRRAFLAACGGLAALSGCLAPEGESGTTTREATEATTREATETTPRTTETGTPAVDRIEVGDGLTWTMAGNGPRNDGYVDTTGPDDDPARAWDVPVDGVYTIPSPAFEGGVVYFGSDDLTYAIDVAEGTVEWTTDLEYLGHHYPAAIDGDRLLVTARTMQGARAGGGEGALYAIDRADGAVDWQVDAPLSSGPTVVEEGTYVTSSDGTGVLHALDHDGNRRWSAEFDPEGARSTSAFREPAVVGDAVFATVTYHRDDGTGDGALCAVDRENGDVLWRYDVGAELRAAPVVGDGLVYAADAAGGIHAVDPEDGDPAWTADLGVEVLTTPVLDDRSVYLLAAGEVFAIDRASGDRNWRTDIGATRMNGMAVAADGVYVGGSDITALAPDDGRIRWKYPIPGEGGGYGAPIVLDGVVFTGACIKETASSMYDDHMFALV